MERRRQRRAHETGPHAAPVDDRNRQRRLDPHVRFRADAAQEREGLVIAPDEDVLTVVHPLARLAIGERGGAAAKRRTRFEHEHARAAVRERTRGAQACEASADHDHVVVRHSGTALQLQPLSARRSVCHEAYEGDEEQVNHELVRVLRGWAVVVLFVSFVPFVANPLSFVPFVASVPRSASSSPTPSRQSARVVAAARGCAC